jgi:hypothetical protein
MLANFSDEELTVPKATILGVAQEISESLVDKVNSRSEVNSTEPSKNEVQYDKLLKGKLDHLTPEDRQHIEPVIMKNAHIFHDEETNDFKGTTVIEHEIPIGDARPIRRPPYRTPYTL